MKKLISFILAAVMCVSFSACSNTNNAELKETTVPGESQIKSICELATMQCYYHNVAKYYEEKAGGILGTKDRKFWIEYSGVVTIGVDTSKVSMVVDGDVVTITIPPAKVLSCKVDENTLTEDSFIIPKDSARVEAEHQTAAYKEAQEKMRKAANDDTVLLTSAQTRMQKLLEDYVNNIGNCTGRDYTIRWVYLDGDEQTVISPNESVEPEVAEER